MAGLRRTALKYVQMGITRARGRGYVHPEIDSGSFAFILW